MIRIFAFSGDGGWIASGGFKTYVNSLGRETIWYADSGRDTNKVVADVLSKPGKIVFLGYSLGANGCAWNQQALRIYCSSRNMKTPTIDLLVGFDPTKNGPSLTLYPIEKHVKRCLLFQQTAWWYPTSLFFGRGVYTGVNIEVTQVREDHLWVQSDKNLQKICTNAISALGS